MIKNFDPPLTLALTETSSGSFLAYRAGNLTYKVNDLPLSGKNSVTGFTLLELIIVVTIGGILLAIAVPSFDSMIRNNRLTAYANDLVTAMNLARSEAIKRGSSVTVRKVDASSCTATGTNWEDGWDVFTDVNGNGICNGGAGGDTLIKTYVALNSPYTLRGRNNVTGIDIRNFVTFTPNGEITPVGAATASGTGRFIICDNRDGNNVPEPNTARLIVVNPLGQLRTAQDTNNDGIPNTNNVASSASNITTCLL